MQVGDEFVVMVETTITANGKTIENPIIRVTKSGSGNPSFVYFIDNQTVGQPRHWYVGDVKGNVVISDVDVVDSTTSTALATALTNQLTAAGYLSGSHTGTVNDVPATYNRMIVVRSAVVRQIEGNFETNKVYLYCGDYAVPLYATYDEQNDVVDIHYFGDESAIMCYDYDNLDIGEILVRDILTTIELDGGTLYDIANAISNSIHAASANTVYDDNNPPFSFDSYFEI